MKTRAPHTTFTHAHPGPRDPAAGGGRAARVPGVLVLAALAVGAGGCSGASVPYIYSSVEREYTYSRCETLRTNMMAATDPVEIRYWELRVEDLKCPSPQAIIDHAR
ncbi:hypothetical protein IHV25_05310 [Phaeovibrio sulfidiphilus]|uniref:Uncharacterized protein n=1 Tax=Phaeovibrio sulfidiphilus TaxID=1220600 RepID=A0A8J6YWR8_9PROT|nr:hypothetical protein [Phaeovibrio sulfidiphilus]MBE1237062.1 hypothetical protein [Phaeovibrio sulfidiphilus]